MNKTKQSFYKLISKMGNLSPDDYKLERFIEAIMHPNILGIFSRKKDITISGSDYNIKTRVFIPKKETKNIIIYIHGGGYVKGSINSYSNLCSRLCKKTNSYVILLSYRLSPEYPYPYPLNDCYFAVKNILNNDDFDFKNMNTIIMGDSVGANLAIETSYLLYKNSDITNLKQILLYPSLDNRYNNYNNNYKSFKKYGEDYILTKERMESYINSYIPLESDRINPLTAPLLMKNYKFLNDVLIITASYDLLKDEGYELYKRLKEEKANVTYASIEDTLHGFYHSAFEFKKKKEVEALINKFINKDSD